MAPPPTQTLLSPAELSFLHSSLSLDSPIRPDLRSPTQFRPLTAETDILSSTNGSARICFSDGTEAIVGIKAEVEKTPRQYTAFSSSNGRSTDADMNVEDQPDSANENAASQKPRREEATSSLSDAWIEASVEIPGYRDDDNLPVFLASMITETLLAEDTLKHKLYINARWHWKLYIDILLLSAPLSYPLPLLSLTTHLALLDARLPRLTSDVDDDPMFDDDWDAAVPLYIRNDLTSPRPPITLLVMTVGTNIVFDPSGEELAVAESVLAISVIPSIKPGNGIRVLAMRSIDPPSRMTPPGIPHTSNAATAGAAGVFPTQSSIGDARTVGNVVGAPLSAAQEVLAEREKGNLWTPPRGGIKRTLIAEIVKAVVAKGGVGEEVLDGLSNVKT